MGTTWSEKTRENIPLRGSWKITGLKRCSKCFEFRRLEFFYFVKKTGYPSSHCRVCANRGLVAPKNAWKSGVKKCPHCKEIKPLSGFSITKTGKRKGQPATCCKPCSVKKQKISRERRVAKDPLLYRKKEWPVQLLKKYGITVEQYNAMLESQNGCCAICKTETPGNRKGKLSGEWKFSVDHCHATGVVRGLLCNHCNAALGLAKDNPDLLEIMADYLRRSLSRE